MERMPELTRKRVKDKPECWHVHYAAVHVGTIAERSGNPPGTDRWRWSCGFYPGSHPGEQRDGTAQNFQAARDAFGAAWRDYLPLRTEADFDEWRSHAAWTAEKYRRFDGGLKLDPPNWGPGKPCKQFMKCPCGVIFNMVAPAGVQIHVPHITAAERAVA
jgi:hypothetical protein